MTINSLYIFNRHCACVYYADWHRSQRPKPAATGAIIPGVARAVTTEATNLDADSRRNTLVTNSGIVIATGSYENDRRASTPSTTSQQVRVSSWTPSVPVNESQNTSTKQSGLPFDEEAKLVYGAVLSLRNMMKKLSKREEQFTCYRTSTYKLHLYETLSGFKFVMLTDPNAESVRFILRQLYAGPFLEYVVRNPLVSIDSTEQGIDNEHFRAATDRFIRGLSIYQ